MVNINTLRNYIFLSCRYDELGEGRASASNSDQTGTLSRLNILQYSSSFVQFIVWCFHCTFAEPVTTPLTLTSTLICWTYLAAGTFQYFTS